MVRYDPPFTLPPSEIAVRRLGAFSTSNRGGSHSNEGLYIPIAPAFLLAETPVPVDLYRLNVDERLEPFLPAGERIDSITRRQALEGTIRSSMYGAVQDMLPILKFQEETMPAVLQHAFLEDKAKARAIYNFTMNLAKVAHDQPKPLHVYRICKQINLAVDWVLADEKKRLPLLLSMARKEYSNAAHAVNVGHLGIALTMELYHGKSNMQEVVRSLAPGFFLHDIGKGFVRVDIQNKPGPLQELEWVEMKKHPQYGNWFLDREKLLSQDARNIVLQHHERADGQGYPHGAAGAAISEGARMCAIIDAYDALTTTRTFRQFAHKPYDALQIM
jgi:HD-GYP domain-containing protein (c-di-GMP phosphodiesterase class II)